LAYQTRKLKEEKAALVSKYGNGANDSGSTEVQVALLTSRINGLTEHLRKHKKDFSTQRGLLYIVGQRRRLLNYLRGSSPQRYLKLIGQLELRK